jgi:hypothetical protein
MLAAASFAFETAPPYMLLTLVVLAWAMPIPCAIAGWWVLRDLPRARRRYRSQALAIVAAYLAVVASGAVVALTAGRDGPALGVGSCCLTVAGPLVGMILLIQPSALRAGNGDVGRPEPPARRAPAATPPQASSGPAPDADEAPGAPPRTP